MDKPLKLYKLIILYILNRVDFPLTNAQISEFILEEGYYRRRDGDCLLFPQ